MKVYCIIEMDSVSRGMSLAARALDGDEIQLETVPFPGPGRFIGIFGGKRSELITVMDTIFSVDGTRSIRKTVIPSPEENLMDFQPPYGRKAPECDLGILELDGYGLMLRCVDAILKTPGINVIKVEFEPVFKKSAIHLSGVSETLNALFGELKGLLGYTGISATTVIKSPSKDILKLYSRHEKVPKAREKAPLLSLRSI